MMAVYKNKATQKVACFAYDSTDGSAKTGDASNITAQISIDGAATAATNDTNPTELDAADAPGIYLFDLTQAESNGDLLVIAPVSSTSNILIEPLIIYTEPETRAANVTAMDADTITASALAADAGAELAALVETYIVNEGDATAVLQAIADKVAADWVAGDASPLAIVAALKADAQWSNLATMQSNITSILGDISNRSKLWLTVKRRTEDTDDQSVIQITEAGGLIVLNGSTDVTSGNGVLTVDDENDGDITITLGEAETAALSPVKSLVYDVQVLTSAGNVTTLTEAAASVDADVTRATS